MQKFLSIGKWVAVPLIVCAVTIVVAVRCGTSAAVPTNYKAFLFVANGSGTGNIHAHAIDSTTGAIGAKAVPGTLPGGIPRSLVFHPTNKFVYATHTTGIYGFTVAATTGNLLEIAGSPWTTGSTGSTAVVTPDGKILIAAGQNGDVISYSVNLTTGALTAIGSAIPSGIVGSFGMAISADGKHVYVGGVTSSNVGHVTVDTATGALTAGAPIAAGTNVFELALTANGKFLYALNLGSSDVSAYTVDSTTGNLTAAGTTALPTGVAGMHSSPNSGFVAVVSNAGGVATVTLLSVNATTGALTEASGSPITLPSTIAAGGVKFDPQGKFLFTTHPGSSEDMSEAVGYSFNSTTGATTLVTGSPFSICSSILALNIALIAQP